MRTLACCLLLALASGQIPGETPGVPIKLADADHVSAFIRFLDRLTEYTFKYAVFVEYKIPAFSGNRGPVELLTGVYEDVLMQDQGVEHMPIEWREATGVVPKYNKTAVHEIAMLRTGRFERKIGDTFPRPYNQYVGTLWTYFTLLAQIASNPDPGRFNQTNAQLVRLYFDSAKGFEAMAHKLFSDEFIGKPNNGEEEGDLNMKATHEILRWYPKLIAGALLKEGHASFGSSNNLGEDVISGVEVDAAGGSTTIGSADAQARQTRLEALAHERRSKTKDSPPSSRW
jgi:hypothetical protein